MFGNRFLVWFSSEMPWNHAHQWDVREWHWLPSRFFSIHPVFRRQVIVFYSLPNGKFQSHWNRHCHWHRSSFSTHHDHRCCLPENVSCSSLYSYSILCLSFLWITLYSILRVLKIWHHYIRRPESRLMRDSRTSVLLFFFVFAVSLMMSIEWLYSMPFILLLSNFWLYAWYFLIAFLVECIPSFFASCKETLEEMKEQNLHPSYSSSSSSLSPVMIAASVSFL